MVFLREKYIAGFFSLAAFLVAFLSGFLKGATLLYVFTRATGVAIVAYFVGIIFGSVIRNLFAETIIHYKKIEDKEKEEKKRIREEKETMALAAHEEAQKKG